MTTEPVVLLETAENGRIWIITMNRPHRLNAMGGGLTGELTKTWKAFRDDPDARVAILTGAGRAFSAGADLKETSDRREAESKGETAHSREEGWTPLSERIDLWKPTIAAVNGFAVAGGFMMAMQCDIRIAAENAEFGIPEVRWNMPGAAWIAPLTRIIGLGHALELSLWGDARISSQRAYEIGFVNRVVPADNLMDEARSWADRILHLAPRAMRNIKEALYRGYYMTPMEVTPYAQALEYNLHGMEDSREGPRAFSEKRTPIFKDE